MPELRDGQLCTLRKPVLARNTPAIHCAISLALLLLLWLSGGERLAAQSTPEEYQTEAKYLLHFAQLVTWPDDTAASSSDSVVLCTLGTDPFPGSLDRMEAGKVIGARPIQVRHLAQVEEATACQVLFISRDEDKQLPVLLPALHNAPVLTVGETPDFLLSGGMICFVLDENNVRFEINLDAARAARLKIGSRLLFLAQNVIGDVRAR
jgi:hypothetical protein